MKHWRYTYFWYEDQDQDAGSANKYSSAQDYGEHISEVVQGVCCHDDDSCNNTGDIDGNGYVLGIIQSLHFDLSGWEGKKDCHDLQKGFVAVENAKSNVTVHWMTNDYAVSLNFHELLRKVYQNTD